MLSEHGQLCQGRAAPTVLGGESGIRSPGKPIKIVEYAQERHASTPPGYTLVSPTTSMAGRRPFELDMSIISFLLVNRPLRVRVVYQ